MVEADESSVWGRASRGDERAFGALFDRHYGHVFRHVLRIAEQPADADEVTAAVFLALWDLRLKVRAVNGSVLPWLFVTAGNLARNHGRRAQRYRRVIDRLPRDEAFVDAAEVVAERDIEARRASALAIALRQLPMKDAQLIALTAINDVTINDAAEVLALTPGAARVRLHRARHRLRELVELPIEYELQEGLS